MSGHPKLEGQPDATSRLTTDHEELVRTINQAHQELAAIYNDNEGSGPDYGEYLADAILSSKWRMRHDATVARSELVHAALEWPKGLPKDWLNDRARSLRDVETPT